MRNNHSFVPGGLLTRQHLPHHLKGLRDDIVWHAEVALKRNAIRIMNFWEWDVLNIYIYIYIYFDQFKIFLKKNDPITPNPENPPPHCNPNKFRGVLTEVSSGCKNLHGVIAKELDCSLEVSKFKFQWCYYIYFQTNILRKGMNSLITPAMG